MEGVFQAQHTSRESWGPLLLHLDRGGFWKSTWKYEAYGPNNLQAGNVFETAQNFCASFERKKVILQD